MDRREHGEIDEEKEEEMKKKKRSANAERHGEGNRLTSCSPCHR
jgi:hypothetical protein